MEEKSLLLQLTGDMPLFKLLDFLVEHKGLEFTKTEIIEGADVSRASLFNYWDELEKYTIVTVTRQEGKTKYYTLNSKSLIAQRILDLEKALISEALEKNARKKKEILITA